MKEPSPVNLTPLPSIVKVRPMLMLTGFLGAGKTTLLRALLEHLANRNIFSDVILNDRENAYIDKATLKEQAADISALTGSCVCCEGFHHLIELILKASKSQHDLLLIELNGTADPVPLQESFTLLDSKFCLRPRWQVCVIDSRHFRKRRRFNDLESLQLETASHYYVSWDSDLREEEKARLEKEVKSINPRATRTSALMLAEALSQSLSGSRYNTLSPREPLRKVMGADTGFTLNPPDKKSHHQRHKIAHEFTGCQVIIPEAVPSERIIHWLNQLPDSVIRAKALLSVSSDNERFYLYERVGKVTSPDPISAQRKTERPCSGIFIGPDLNPEEILQLTQKHLHPLSHFPEDPILQA